MTKDEQAPSEQQVLEIIVGIARLHLEQAERFDVPAADLPGRRLVADLGLDSVQLLTLAMEVENHFQITLDEVDPLAEPAQPASGDGPESSDGAVETVADLVAAVRRGITQRECGEN